MPFHTGEPTPVAPAISFHIVPPSVLRCHLSLPTSSLDSVLTNYNIYVWHNSLENAGSLHIDLEDKKTKTVKHLAVTRLYDTIRTLATHHSNTYFFATFKR